MVYPVNIAERLADIQHAKPLPTASGVGTGASFSCGSFIRFSLDIDVETALINDVGFRSNGCGYMLVAADGLSENLIGRRLTDLHGLHNYELSATIKSVLGANADGRRDCVEACFQAIHSALSDFRVSRIEEFAGEKALICTCFGVTEDCIDQVIRENSADSVDDVSAICNAGLGCGSCRMMIDEMIDAHHAENFVAEK